MDTSMFDNPIFQSIPPEKQAFLKAFSTQPKSENANDLAKQLTNAAAQAKQQGLSFNDAETTLLINMLKQNMTPEEQAKADRVIALFHTFKH